MWYLLCRARSLSLCPLKGSRKSLRLSLRNVGYQCRIGSSALLGEATLATLMTNFFSDIWIIYRFCAKSSYIFYFYFSKFFF